MHKGKNRAPRRGALQGQTTMGTLPKGKYSKNKGNLRKYKQNIK